MIDKESAIQFLKKHQPLPEDKYLSRELIEEYDVVRKYFLQHPDAECIPLFLNSFGEIDGLGVYQLVEDVIVNFSKKEVLPHLQQSLKSDKKGIKYWNAQIASSFPDKSLIGPLKKILNEDDSDLKFASITALASINAETVLDILEEAFNKEKDEDILEFLQEVLDDLKTT